MLIIAHGDLDGITSAFLLKKEYPEAKVVFIQPFDLVPLLKEIDEPVIIADIGIQEQDVEFVEAKLKELMRKFQFNDPMVYDHHGTTEKIVNSGIRVVWDESMSTSMLVYLALHAGIPKLKKIALLGAISDKMIDRRTVPRELREISAILSAAIGFDAADNNFRHEILNNLESIEKILPEARRRADLARKKKEELVRLLIKQAIKCDSFLIIKTDREMMGYAGAVANTICKRTGKHVIIVFPSNIEGKVAITSRGPNNSSWDLASLISRIASEVGGRGGGHRRAAGGMIPASKIGEFLSRLLREVME